MKRGAILVLFAILIISVDILQSENEIKIAPEVFEKVEEGNVSVFIELTSSKKIQTDETFESIEIEHNFGELVSAIISEENLQELELNPNVESVKLVGIKKIFLQDSAPLINATSVWSIQMNNLNLTGAGETVCILDTGANFSHPDLIGKNLTCVINCYSEDCVPNCSISDGNGHGTHVAGIIGANGLLKGVAPRVNLISVKVCDNDGFCYDNDIRAGIDWCVDYSKTYNISIISMSLGGGQYDYYCDGIDDDGDLTTGINNAVAKNISVVVATGNTNLTQNPEEGIASPSCIQNATRVSATDDNDNFAYFAFRHQNFLDILTAPGVDITSTWNNRLSEVCSGTSMATPHVAGAIALINQFKKLELNKTLTKDEIKNSLINSGKKVFDTETNTNFTRVDVYSAILFLDETSPDVSLISPDDNSINSSTTQRFRCNATDLLQLSNLTLKIWNSTGIYFENTTYTSNNPLSLEQNVNLELGQYEWNCIASDRKNNIGLASGNFTISTNEIVVNLNSPVNNLKTNQNQTFNCSANSINELSNATFYLWNSSSLEYNETKNISGIQNSTQFNYNFASEGDYKWNCFFSSGNSSFAISNYSLIYDISKPNITLINPINDYSTTETSINFQFNVTDNFEIANCSLMINDIFAKSNESEITNLTNTIQYSLSAGNYVWKINCIDETGNAENSSQRSLIITQVSSSSSSSGSSSSGGGGGGSSTTKIIKITEKEIKQGATKEIKMNDKLNFEIKTQLHNLILNSIDEQKATITISSNPIIITLAVSQSRKINLDDDEFYDLEISLLSIEKSKAKINIKEINEEIPVKKILAENETEQRDSKITGGVIENSNSNFGFLKKVREWLKEIFRKIGELFG